MDLFYFGFSILNTGLHEEASNFYNWLIWLILQPCVGEDDSTQVCSLGNWRCREHKLLACCHRCEGGYFLHNLHVTKFQNFIHLNTLQAAPILGLRMSKCKFEWVGLIILSILHIYLTHTQCSDFTVPILSLFIVNINYGLFSSSLTKSVQIKWKILHKNQCKSYDTTQFHKKKR